MYNRGMYPFIAFLCTNFLLFSWIYFFHSAVPFSELDYRYNAHHYIQDTRKTENRFSLLNALGQYDSQFYLLNADRGYTYRPKKFSQNEPMIVEGLTYVFFPLYPALVAILNTGIRDIELSAFLMSNFLLLLICFSLYYVTSQWFSKTVAKKTLLLFLVFPFGIFLRGYYSEGIRMLLLIWFCYALTQKRWVLAGVTVGFMGITNGSALSLLPFYWCVLAYQWFRKRMTLQKGVLLLLLSAVPFLGWMLFCYIQTGDPIYFFWNLEKWGKPPVFPLIYNASLIIMMMELPVRAFHASQLDVMMVVIVSCLLYLSYRTLPKIVWGATLVVFLTHLALQDTISTLRYTLVLFPLYIYLAKVLRGWQFWLLWGIFVCGMLWVSLVYVNWYWVE